MYSKILIKLIDQAIVPAVMLLAARVLSVVFFAGYFKVEYSFGSTGFIFADPSQYVQVNSYSILSMIVVLTVGVMYVLTKAFAFHDTHISPHNTARLFSMRLSSFIQSSYDVYSQGVIWLSYAYLMLFVAGVLMMFEFLYAWVFFVSLVLTVISTVLFVLDVEREIYSHFEVADIEKVQEEYVLTLGSLE